MESDSDDGFTFGGVLPGVKTSSSATIPTTALIEEPRSSALTVINAGIDLHLRHAVFQHARNQFMQPWDRDPFSGCDQLRSTHNALFTLQRTAPRLLPEIEVVPAQKLFKTTMGKAMSFAMRVIPTIKWPEARVALREQACRLWRIIVEENCMATKLGTELHNLVVEGADEISIQEVITDTFRDKAPSTLMKRGRSLLAYMKFVRIHYGVPGLPVLEPRAYHYVKSVIEAKCSPSIPGGFISALNFSIDLLEAQGASDASSSARIKGASNAHLSTKGPTKQAKVLKTSWVNLLERAVFCAVDIRNKVASGFFCMMIHGRPRFSDLQLATSIFLDLNSEGSGYIEALSSEVKTARTVQLRNQLMPLVAPVFGIYKNSWAIEWMNLRVQQKIDKFRFLLPSFGSDGNWVDDNCDSTVASRWLRSILRDMGVPETELEGVSTHSLKATSLSWCSKFGVGYEDRQLLGRHVPSHLTSAVTYSRDALATPLRKYEEVLAAIRSGEFSPDETRAGRFIRRDSSAEQNSDLSTEVIEENPFQEGMAVTGVSSASAPAVVLEPRDLESASLSSDSESDSSSDDESNTSETQGLDLSKRRPTNISIPSNSRLYVCRTSRLLHIRTSGSGNIEEGARLRCGKRLTLSYKTVTELHSRELCRCITCFASLAIGRQEVVVVA